jgi:hypothetical protein
VGRGKKKKNTSTSQRTYDYEPFFSLCSPFGVRKITHSRWWQNFSSSPLLPIVPRLQPTSSINETCYTSHYRRAQRVWYCHVRSFRSTVLLFIQITVLMIVLDCHWWTANSVYAESHDLRISCERHLCVRCYCVSRLDAAAVMMCWYITVNAFNEICIRCTEDLVIICTLPGRQNPINNNIKYFLSITRLRSSCSRYFFFSSFLRLYASCDILLLLWTLLHRRQKGKKNPCTR